MTGYKKCRGESDSPLQCYSVSSPQACHAQTSPHSPNRPTHTEQTGKLVGYGSSHLYPGALSSGRTTEQMS